MTNQAHPTLPETDAVVVLSADSLDTLSFEDQARIELGVRLIFERAKTDSNLQPELILNGASEQLPLMAAFAEKLGFPQSKTCLVNCGPKREANTKTQLEAIAELSLDHVTLVTSWYHIPRVLRTAKKCLPSNMKYDAAFVPKTALVFDVCIVRGEIRRIEEYISKGDIARTP